MLATQPKMQKWKLCALKVPDLRPELATQAVAVVHQLRQMDLRKTPSISETLDWARALVALNADNIDEETLTNTYRPAEI